MPREFERGHHLLRDIVEAFGIERPIRSAVLRVGVREVPTLTVEHLVEAPDRKSLATVLETYELRLARPRIDEPPTVQG